MKVDLEFSLIKVIFIFIIGGHLGGVVVLFITDNISLTSGVLQTATSIILLILVLTSCHKRERAFTQQKKNKPNKISLIVS